MSDKFPNPAEIIDFLENSDTTYTDVIYEIKRMTDFNHILAVCKTSEDVKEYIHRLETITSGLRACIQESDPKLKYFYYGMFYGEAKLLSTLLASMYHKD